MSEMQERIAASQAATDLANRQEGRLSTRDEFDRTRLTAQDEIAAEQTQYDRGRQAVTDQRATDIHAHTMKVNDFEFEQKQATAKRLAERQALVAQALTRHLGPEAAQKEGRKAAVLSEVEADITTRLTPRDQVQLRAQQSREQRLMDEALIRSNGDYAEALKIVSDQNEKHASRYSQAAKDYRTLAAFKQLDGAGRYFDQMIGQARERTNSSDIGLIVSAIRVNDPFSIVTGEETSLQEGGRIPAYLVKQFNRLKGDGGFLRDQDRQEIINAAAISMQSNAKSLFNNNKYWRENMERMGLDKADIEAVIMEVDPGKYDLSNYDFTDVTVGEEEDGFKYMGGDRTDPKNWTPVEGAEIPAVEPAAAAVTQQPPAPAPQASPAPVVPAQPAPVSNPPVDGAGMPGIPEADGMVTPSLGAFVSPEEARRNHLINRMRTRGQ